MLNPKTDNPNLFRDLGRDLLVYDRFVSPFDQGYPRPFALYSYDTERATEGVELVRCGDCSSLVFDIVEHVDWHLRIEARQ